MRQLYLIVDVNLRAAQQEGFEALGFSLLFPEKMSLALINWESWRKFNRNTTIMVLAGNGAARVGSFFQTDWLGQWQYVAISAKRIWLPGQDPKAVSGRIHSSMLLGVKNVVILDDVISSGVTIQKIREVNVPWIPGASWHAAVWVAQRAANVRGFSSTFAVTEVGDRNTKTPLNSISTLVAEPEIASSYAKRNFPDPTKFLELLAGLR
jgi:hypothetical protein